MSGKKIIVGARGSLLSVAQAKGVIALLKKKSPDYNFSLKKITTLGDKAKYWQRDAVGIFTKELEEGLLDEKIDIAVHSAKDLPSKIPAGLILAAITKRETPYDCIIFKEKTSLSGLKKGAVIGTGSPRRMSQLLRWRADLRIKNLRGNLDTRLKKLRNEGFDAIVAATAGIRRLKYRKLCLERIPAKIMLPAAGQGALGLEIRKGDKALTDIVRKINHPPSLICMSCERAFIKELAGGCRTPVGALARIKDKKVFLEAKILSSDGKKAIYLKKSGPIEAAEALGRALAQEAIKKGAKQILKINETKM